MGVDTGYGSYDVDTSEATTQQQLDSYTPDADLQAVLAEIGKGVQTVEQTTGLNLGGDQFSAVSGAALPRLSNDFLRSGSSAPALPGEDKSFWASIKDVWGDTKSDMKTSIVASMISGMFGAKTKQQMADASTKNAESAMINAKANADLANTKVQQVKNASGLIGSVQNTTPVYKDLSRRGA